MPPVGESGSDRPLEAQIDAPGEQSSQAAQPQHSSSGPGTRATSPSVELSELRPSVQAAISGSNHVDTHIADTVVRPAEGALPSGPNGLLSPQVATLSSAPDTSIASVRDSGIGPATDKPTSVLASPSPGPRLVITLLLHSTETRHPYTINESYLTRRNVNVLENNPVNMSVYTLKELIWRDWREEWEPRPSSPSSIRLIHMGRLLDDKAYLKDSRFSIGDTPHVVHMTIKPQEAVDDEDARIAKGGGRDRDGEERSTRCRCTIM